MVGVIEMAPPWRKSPLPPNWGRLRRAVLDRDGWMCQLRGPHCTGRATEVDHIGAHDDHSPTNLQAVCATCHRSKTGKQARARRNIPTRKRPKETHPGLVVGEQ